jgi:hypothetical protein
MAALAAFAARQAARASSNWSRSRRPTWRLAALWARRVLGQVAQAHWPPPTARTAHRSGAAPDPHSAPHRRTTGRRRESDIGCYVRRPRRSADSPQVVPLPRARAGATTSQSSVTAAAYPAPRARGCDRSSNLEEEIVPCPTRGRSAPGLAPPPRRPCDAGRGAEPPMVRCRLGERRAAVLARPWRPRRPPLGPLAVVVVEALTPLAAVDLIEPCLGRDRAAAVEAGWPGSLGLDLLPPVSRPTRPARAQVAAEPLIRLRLGRDRRAAGLAGRPVGLRLEERLAQERVVGVVPALLAAIHRVKSLVVGDRPAAPLAFAGEGQSD